ncbi:hypothetical protein LCGC14_2134020, partial [marine sediment metagenome]
GVNDHYNAAGLVGIATGFQYGSINMNSNSAVIGVGGELDTEDNWTIDITSADVSFKQVIVPHDITNSFIVCALINSKAQGTSAEAAFLTQADDGFGFIFDPTISANWRIYTNKVGVSTVVQTTTAVTLDVRSKLETSYNLATDTVTYTINGTVVGTINTNTPINTSLFLTTYNGNKTTASQNIDIDFWQCSSTRLLI